MSGSIKFFKYTAEDGAVFAFRADESNLEAIGNITGVNEASYDLLPADAIVYTLPRNLKPRSCVFASADSLKRLRIIVPTAAIFSALDSSAQITVTDQVNGNFTLSLRQKTGERVNIPIAADTGLDDGDDT